MGKVEESNMQHYDNTKTKNNRDTNRNNWSYKDQKLSKIERVMFGAKLLKDLPDSDYNCFTEVVKDFAKNAKNISNSSIRKFYDTLNKVLRKKNNPDTVEFRKLKYQIAYQIGRIERKKIKDRAFFEMIMKCVTNIIKSTNNNEADEKRKKIMEEKIENLREFLEIFMAYKKYFGDDK